MIWLRPSAISQFSRKRKWKRLLLTRCCLGILSFPYLVSKRKKRGVVKMNWVLVRRKACVPIREYLDPLIHLRHSPTNKKPPLFQSSSSSSLVSPYYAAAATRPAAPTLHWYTTLSLKLFSSAPTPSVPTLKRLPWSSKESRCISKIWWSSNSSNYTDQHSRYISHVSQQAKRT